MISLWRIQKSGRKPGPFPSFSETFRSSEFFRSAWDPSEDVAPTLLCRANFASSPWRSENYGYVGRELAEATNPPTVGAAQNGWFPSAFDGAVEVLRFAVAEEVIGVSTGWACTCVVRFDTLAAPAGASINDPCIFAIGPFSAAVALSVNSSGVCLVQYDGFGASFETARIAVSTGQYYRIQARWDGSELWLRVDNGTPETMPGIASIAAAGTESLVVGANYDETAHLHGRILELGFLAEVVPDAPLDAWDAYAVARYFAVAYTSRCLVLLNGRIQECPDVGPFGQRLVLTSGYLTTTPTGGKSLVLVGNTITQAATETGVRVPP